MLVALSMPDNRTSENSVRPSSAPRASISEHISWLRTKTAQAIGAMSSLARPWASSLPLCELLRDEFVPVHPLRPRDRLGTDVVILARLERVGEDRECHPEARGEH